MTGGTRSAGDALPGTQLNIARDQATQNIVHDGVLTVYQGGPLGYRVDEFPLTAPSVPVGVRRQPSRLLAARYQVVDFTGRDTELAQLADWRDDPGWAWRSGWCLARVGRARPGWRPRSRSAAPSGGGWWPGRCTAAMTPRPVRVLTPGRWPPGRVYPS